MALSRRASAHCLSWEVHTYHTTCVTHTHTHIDSRGGGGLDPGPRFCRRSVAYLVPLADRVYFILSRGGAHPARAARDPLPRI